MGSYRMCVCFTRRFRITDSLPPEDVKEAFKEYTGGGTNMTAEQLLRFLMQVQGEGGASIADAERTVERVLKTRHHLAVFTRQSLTLDDFFYYLFSPDLNPPINSQVSQDMTAPLSHYFIYTGHNSYLTGNQLSSNCSDVPIIRALERGVRVVELDLWPNSSKTKIQVLHGRTLTTPVDFLRCLRSIKQYAFSASPYPLIITLEDHLTPELQVKAAKMITETFGKMLYIPERECFEEFPSPEELKHKIMISTKPPKEYLKAKGGKHKRKPSMKEKDSDEDEWGRDPSDSPADHEDEKVNTKCKTYLSDCDASDEDDADEQELPEVADYKRLIAIQARKAKGGLREALKVEVGKVRRISLSEQRLEKAAESHGTDVVRFTQKNFLRVYPKGTRFNSSNYKPFVGWMHGAQMVAFNMQGYGRNLWLMQGMFRSNGRCGYVKKPDFLMNVDPDGRVFDPKEELPVKKTLRVKVYMGDGWRMDFKKTHFDLYSPPDFYTKVGIAGLSADKKMAKTKIKEDVWNPDWGEEFTFPLTVPELALLRVEVHEYNISEKDDFGGQTCLPVSELRQGIHAVPLFDRKGQQYKSVRLLMRFDFV